MKSPSLFVCIALGVVGCANITGERDILAGHMVYSQPYATFPQPNPPVALPLVMIVGPPGATSCWAARVPAGAPWSGAVDQDRTVTVALMPSRDAIAQRYECQVRPPDGSRAHLETRYVPYVEFPLDPTERQRRHAEQMERRRHLCESDAEMTRQYGLSCDLSKLEYEPARRLQPLIVHVGAIDSLAHERWRRLRERLETRCAAGSTGFVQQATRNDSLCSYLTDGTWEALEGADIGDVIERSE